MDPLAPPAIPVDTTDHVNAIVLPTFAGLSILIIYLPFKSFYLNRNFPACNLVFLAFILNITTIINASIWPNGDWASWWMGYGYCDIQAYTKLAITTGVSTTVLSLTISLSNAIDVDKHCFNTTAALRRRALMGQVAMCWGIPVLQIGLFYIVQVSRYAIAPVFGCTSFADTSWATVVILLIWAPLGSIASGYFAILIMIRLRKHRANLSKALSSNSSGYTARRYLKLSFMSLTLILVFIPVQLYYLHLALPPFYVPYSWSRVHNPAASSAIIFLSTSDAPNLQYNGWVSVTFSFIIFLFFGFNDSAADTYRRMLVRLGLGKIWPSLKLPRAERKRRRSENRTGWSSHFDLVSKALYYFDGSRKPSEASSDTYGPGCDSRSRQDSNGNAEHIVLSSTNSNSLYHDKSPLAIVQSVNDIEHQDPDAITFAPLGSNEPHAMSITPQTTSNIITHSATPPPRGILSVFRTHINLQFPRPTLAPKATTPVDWQASSTTSQYDNTSAQHSPRNGSVSNPAPAYLVQTAIWSGPTPVSSNADIKSSTAYPSTSNVTSGTASSQDPLSPALGSRAYRERERREMEQDKIASMQKDMTTSRHNSDAGLGYSGEQGVMKTTKMERREEDGTI